jgi:acetyltransferase-like isoleucine patch superfamily enzyme
MNKIYPEAWIGEKVIMGIGCKIQPFAFIPDGVTIGNNVFVGPHVTFTNDKYPPSNGKSWMATRVNDGASIGAGATILPGIIIGKDAVIGAGAVVTKNVPGGETWVGNPAARLGTTMKKSVGVQWAK